MTAELYAHPMLVTEQDMHAYVDGGLDQAKRSAVEDLLLSDADVQMRVEQYRHQNIKLHAAFDVVLDEPVPRGLKALGALIDGELQRQRMMRVRDGAAALLIGLSVFCFATSTYQALLAESDVDTAVAEVSDSPKANLGEGGGTRATAATPGAAGACSADDMAGLNQWRRTIASNF